MIEEANQSEAATDSRAVAFIIFGTLAAEGMFLLASLLWL